MEINISYIKKCNLTNGLWSKASFRSCTYPMWCGVIIQDRLHFLGSKKEIVELSREINNLFTMY